MVLAIHDLISIMTIVMVIVYGYQLLLMAIGYGYLVFDFAIDYCYDDWFWLLDTVDGYRLLLQLLIILRFNFQSLGLGFQG